MLLCLPMIGFGQQFSIKELKSLSNIDSESFEILSMKQGYTFYEIHKSDKGSYDGIRMQYVDGKEITRYITWYSKFYDSKRNVNYQTTLESELIGIYEELKSLGFTLSTRKKEERFYYKEYMTKDKKEKIKILNMNDRDWITISYSEY